MKCESVGYRWDSMEERDGKGQNDDYRDYDNNNSNNNNNNNID